MIVTSDHGEELWNHGRRAHGQTLYQELVHVPLILRPPPALGLGGRIVERLAHHVDLMPTILSYFGVPAPLGIAGADLLPAISGAALAAPTFVVSQLQHEGVTLECATDFRLKRILEPVTATGAPREELYDLAVDPGERLPLHDPPPARFAALREFHAGMLAQIARARVEGVTLPWAELGEDVRADLTGLGYAGD